MDEAITNVIKICTVCTVNEVEISNLQEETCMSCLEEHGEGIGDPKDLTFEEPDGRKDDRIRPNPSYEWDEEERDHEV